MVGQPKGLFRFLPAEQRQEIEARMDALFDGAEKIVFALGELHRLLENYLWDLLEGEEFR